MIVLLRPGAAHPNMDGALHYAVRPGRGKMDFGYEVVRLWELPAEELLSRDLAVVPLSVLGRLPESETLEEGSILIAGEERLGPAGESIKSRLETITDLERLNRMMRSAVKAANWAEIIETL